MPRTRAAPAQDSPARHTRSHDKEHEQSAERAMEGEEGAQGAEEAEARVAEAREEEEESEQASTDADSGTDEEEVRERGEEQGKEAGDEGEDHVARKHIEDSSAGEDVAADSDEDESEVELSPELTCIARKAARAAANALRLAQRAKDPQCSDAAIFQRAHAKRFSAEMPQMMAPRDDRRSEAAAAKQAALGQSSRGAGYVTNATERRAAKEEARKKQGVGRKWHNFVGRADDTELNQELAALRMRGFVDPKRFYKSAGGEQAAAVQMGTVIEGRGEFFSSRISKKKRARTFVDELLADEGVKSYTKKKLVERMKEQNKGKKNRRKRHQNRLAPVWAKQ